jgi:ubiquinone/menaquinone biosynthesis C-methylase UbiE
MITTREVPVTFDEAAPRYDLMVALNPGYHRHLRAAADALIERLPGAHGRASGAPVRLADLGCGSGASTRALQNAVEAVGGEPQIVGLDASSGMLAQAQSKRWPAGITFAHGFAQQLRDRRRDWGLGADVPGVFAAYLFRNVTERDEVLADVSDLLADDGILVVQEYSVAGRPAAQLIWTTVCWLVVIPLSLLTSGRTLLYRYLWRSVLAFDSVQAFTDRLYAAGFVDVEVRTVPGWQRGILHTFRARRAPRV